MSNDVLERPTEPPIDEASGGTFAPVGIERLVTLMFVAGPPLALGWAVVRFWGHGIGWTDIAVAVAMYVAVGLGIAIGFHRLLTHHSFIAVRPLKFGLAIAGSMAWEGGPVGWVADHRRHHARADRAGDPHSPNLNGNGTAGRLRGLGHAHVGWLFHHESTPPSRYAADIMGDRDLALVDQLFPLWCVLSLAVPFAAGYALGHSLGAALTALLWAGLVRILVFHHVTWSVNSICHWVGERPFVTRDKSTNVSALALMSFGEAWHNGHHAFPHSARHGLLAHQCDLAAIVIRGFERLGWAREVVWPTQLQLAAARVR